MIRIDPYIQLQETLGSEKARAIAEFVEDVYACQEKVTTTSLCSCKVVKSVNAETVLRTNGMRKPFWSSLDINALLMGVSNGLLIAIAYLYLKK